jgi:rhodanese-related sulfurtransferase
MVTEIDRDELKQKLDRGKKSILVEGLPSADFHKLHLPGAINIPADQIESRAPELLPKQRCGTHRLLRRPRMSRIENCCRSIDGNGLLERAPFRRWQADWTNAGWPIVRNDEGRAAA